VKAKELIGREVVGADARKVVGKVADKDLGVASVVMSSIVVEPGLTKKISIPPEDIDGNGGRVVLKVIGDKIRKASYDFRYMVRYCFQTIWSKSTFQTPQLCR